MDAMMVTQRQQREMDYYNQYARRLDLSNYSIDFSPIQGPLLGQETRPWNSYWSIYAHAIAEFKEHDRLLDFGSGPGDNALRFSMIGYTIDGFDISDVNVILAKKIFKQYKKQGTFQVALAENLPYPNNTFNIVIGIDILHHVDIKKSIPEVLRVLKPGGKAFFREPVEVPLLDKIRNTRLLRKIFPKDASFDNHITHDERKLNMSDEENILLYFPDMKKHYFFLFARFDKFLRNKDNTKSSRLEKFDYFLMKCFPFLKKMGGTVIYELKK